MTVKDLRINIGPGLRSLDVYSRREVLSRTNEGDLATSFKGRGVEFAGFRKYSPGDDAQRIDWKASMKTQDILIREFEEFRNHNIFFLFDVSNSMIFGSGDKLKCEYAAEAIYILSDALIKTGDNVGLGMFSDTMHVKLLPDSGQETLSNMTKSLLNNENYGGDFDFKKALTLSKSLLGEKTVIILVSDFIGLPKGWEKYLSMFDDSFEIIGLMIRDPRDLELPVQFGRYLLKDPYSDNNMYVDARKYVNTYKELVDKDIKYISSILKHSKGDFLLLRTDEEFLYKTIKFFNRRSYKH